MKRIGKERYIVFRILLAISGLMALSYTPAAAADLRLVPDSIRIGPFFSGASVHVSGEIPAGKQAVVEMIGKRIEEQLLRKGRHWDIWMSVGEIDIEDAPNLYFALSTDPKEFSQSNEDEEFGYVALSKRTYFKGDVEGMKRTEIFRRFIELKEVENLYRQYPGALEVTKRSEDFEKVEGSFRIPSRVPPGDYMVRLSVVDNGRLLPLKTAQFVIRIEGLPAFLSSLSRKHGALYGLFAVAIAAIFGFLVGVVFRRRSVH